MSPVTDHPLILESRTELQISAKAASVAFTMDTYSHIISGMQEDMMALLDEVLPLGVAARRDHDG